MFKKGLAILLSFVIIISLFTVLPFQASAAVLGDDYPNRNSCAGCHSTANGDNHNDYNYRAFFYRQCTDFVAWRLNNTNGVYFTNSYGGVRWGNAKNWDDAARSIGVTVDGNPAIGAVAQTDAGYWGHVAWVADIIGDDVVIEEYNYLYASAYSKRQVSKYSFNYIHIKDTNPVPDNLRVNVFESQASLNWDWDGNASYYNIKIWRNKVWEGDPYRIVWSVTSNSYGFALPKGTYQAYVDACNDNSGYCKMSNVVTFTIGDVGINLDIAVYGSQVTFNWNSDDSANYSLKVFKEFTWDGELYENIQPLKQTSYTLGLPKGRYQAYVDGNSMSNVVNFTVGEDSPKLSVNIQGNQVYFSWNADNNAKYYNLKIFNGHVWRVDPYEILYDISKTEAGVALPAGTYQAYVDAVGDNYLHMGSVVQFTVGNSSPILNARVVGNQVSFNWTADDNAKSYNLRIYKGHVWQSEVYETVSGIFKTETGVALPAGTYQAYIDAVGDNYLHMGNVIQFTVENASPVLTAIVNGNQVVFSWENNNNAKSYSLKIWNGHAWIGDAYLVKKDLVDTKQTVMLPKGNYQAYIDSFEDNNTIMGNVIDIIVTEDKYTMTFLGDVDGDNQITIMDATLIQYMLANMKKFDSFNETAADVDENGNIEITDATFIQRYEAQIATPYKIGEPIE